MGTVYRARDTQLEREVALKVIETPAMDVQAVLDEARLLARLEHPGIVTVHDAGILPDGRAFCVMRKVEGVRLDSFPSASRSLSERLNVFGKLCDAVAFAHSRGVIHRDLKPENVMIGAFGEVIVLDWGVALWAAEGHGASGAVVGTSRYMPPEQRRGDAVDCRADIYALGVLLEQILPSHPPRPVSAIAVKARSPEPADRYSSVAEMARDVGRYP
jgi:serine/threonine protein kinase